MIHRKKSTDDAANLNWIVDNAIKSEIRDSRDLPEEVRSRLQEIYREFIPVYIEMIRIKENHPPGWRPDKVDIDPEVVEDMLHFFSDYQHLTRCFKRINRQVKVLSKINRRVDPHRFEDCVGAIMSDEKRSSVLCSLMGR